MSFHRLYTFLSALLLEIFFEKDPLLVKVETSSAIEFSGMAPYAESIKKTSNMPAMLALFSYKHPLVKTLVWNMKFRRNKACFKLGGALLHEKLLTISFNSPLIIPVPLSSKRKRERGYNQAECLADEISKLDKEKRFDIEKNALIRKFSPPQTTLSRNERLGNLKGMFAVDKTKVIGRNIIVIDDVITTGATITEIAKVLTQFGAKKVIAISLAH